MVLQLLASYGKSGTLELNDNEERAIIYLKEGFIEAVSVPRSDHLLGSRLVKAGLIETNELRKIILSTRMQGEDEFLGITLLKCGAIDKKAIVKVIEEQAYANTLELSNWVDGTFQFLVPHLPVIFPLSPHINVQHLLLETSRRLDEGRRPSMPKAELTGEELCAACTSDCTKEQKEKYLRDSICLWRNMPILVREAIFQPEHQFGYSDDEEEVKDLPFL
jgi:hypothetical protein